MKHFFHALLCVLLCNILSYRMCAQGVAVDLGLPSGTLWADRNVGANSMTDYGYYFAWGETQTKESYYSTNSLWYEVKYSDLQSKGVIDPDGDLTTQYDAASYNWGNKWRMPTVDEIKELLTLDNEPTEINGVKGRVFTATNGNSIFLPFAGCRYEDELYRAGERGYYWSATAYENDWRAYSLGVDSRDAYLSDYYRYLGFTVRPVLRAK